MRKIEFRAKRADGKGWVEGYYFYDGFQTAHYIRQFAHIPPTREEPGGGWYQEDTEINPETLTQYTGVKDAAGKRIYEGDIMDIGYREKCKIIWHKSGAFMGEDLDRPGKAYCYLPAYGTVIGNIYDNKNLLPNEQQNN